MGLQRSRPRQPQLRYINEEEEEQHFSTPVRRKDQNQYGDEGWSGGHQQNGGQNRQGIQSRSGGPRKNNDEIPEPEGKEAAYELESTESSSSMGDDSDDSDFDPNASGSD